ncbi:MAG: type II toxin-antitoxin system HicB family antitoxin [Candidatus Eremiobacterota bacterium]
MKYPGIIHREDNCCWIEFPDLEGCQTQGDTIEELINNSKEVLFLYMETLAKKALPEPSKLEGENIIYFDIYEACKEIAEKELKEWIKLRENGWTFQRIASKYKVSKQYVSERLDKAGVPHKTKWSKFYSEWERMYYQEEMGLKEIAKITGASYEAIRNYLQKKGLRKQGRKMLSV